LASKGIGVEKEVCFPLIKILIIVGIAASMNGKFNLVYNTPNKK
jgi:hypothetical protein